MLPPVTRRSFLRMAALATLGNSCASLRSASDSPLRAPPRDTQTDLSSQPIWIDEHGLGRNTFAHFRLTFAFETTPAEAWLHLFADTRYRLRINGVIASYGPAAFLIAHPEYDSIDLRPWLRPGKNEITVEVNARGSSSFQAEPSRGGFIAWGSARSARGDLLASFTTPGDWRARRAHAWEKDSPPFSFAQGPVEMVALATLPADGRVVDPAADGWQTPVAAPPSHWGAFVPRSVPLPTFEIWKPERLLVLAPVANPERRVSAHRSLSRPIRWDRLRERRFACALWLHSKETSSPVISATRGDYWLNGNPVTPLAGRTRALESRLFLPLRPGWNLLFGEIRPVGGSVGMIVAWPADAGLEVSAYPVFSDKYAGRIRFTDAMPIDALHALRGNAPADAADLERLGDALGSGEECVSFPSREVAWDCPVATPVEAPDQVEGREIPRNAVGDGIAVYDFGREFIGHIRLEIEAPAGGILDVANEELQREDGAVRMFRTNPGINPVDRLLLRPGLNRWEGFHARGGRLVQLSARSDGPVIVRKISLRSALVAVPASGDFSCSEPLFDWAWNAGVATIVASQTDGWIDPWREQGLYIGDVLVEYLAHRIWSRDTSHIVRALRLWARSQLPDGQLLPVVPSWPIRPHADYTLLWIVILRDYVRHTGDIALAMELWPCVERIWASAVWRAGSHGLWDATGLNVFGDWGATETAVTGEANGILNAFRVGALDAAAQLATWCRKPDRAAELHRERETVVAIFRKVLWDESRNAFAPGLQDGRFVETSAAHANALALLYRIATPEQEPGALALVLAAIEAAATAPERCERRGGHIELYFLHYVLELLGERGRHAEAEKIIRRFWGLQRDHGAWCLWEAFYRGLRREESQCHGWSAGPSVYFHRFVLGIDGTPDRVTITPSAATLTHARGTHPHPRGDITVAWRVEKNAFHLNVELPEGLEHEVRPGAAFANFEPHVSVRIRKPSI